MHEFITSYRKQKNVATFDEFLSELLGVDFIDTALTSDEEAIDRQHRGEEEPYFLGVIDVIFENMERLDAELSMLSFESLVSSDREGSAEVKPAEEESAREKADRRNLEEELKSTQKLYEHARNIQNLFRVELSRDKCMLEAVDQQVHIQSREFTKDSWVAWSRSKLGEPVPGWEPELSEINIPISSDMSENKPLLKLFPLVVEEYLKSERSDRPHTTASLQKWAHKCFEEKFEKWPPGVLSGNLAEAMFSIITKNKDHGK